MFPTFPIFSNFLLLLRLSPNFSTFSNCFFEIHQLFPGFPIFQIVFQLVCCVFLTCFPNCLTIFSSTPHIFSNFSPTHLPNSSSLQTPLQLFPTLLQRFSNASPTLLRLRWLFMQSKQSIAMFTTVSIKKSISDPSRSSYAQFLNWRPELLRWILLCLHQLPPNTSGPNHVAAHILVVRFRKLKFEFGQHVLQHLLTHWLCRTVCNIVLRADLSHPYLLVRESMLQVSSSFHHKDALRLLGCWRFRFENDLRDTHRKFFALVLRPPTPIPFHGTQLQPSSGWRFLVCDSLSLSYSQRTWARFRLCLFSFSRNRPSHCRSWLWARCLLLHSLTVRTSKCSLVYSPGNAWVVLNERLPESSCFVQALWRLVVHLVLVLPHGEAVPSLVDTIPPTLQGVAPQVTISFSVTWRPGVLTRLQMPMSVFLKTLIIVRGRHYESAPPILFFPLFDPRLLLCRLFWWASQLSSQRIFVSSCAQYLERVDHPQRERQRKRERERKVHRQRARVEGSFRCPCTENCRSCWVWVQDLSLPQPQRLSRIVVSLGIHTKLCPFCGNLRCQMVAHLVIVLLESSEECPRPSWCGLRLSSPRGERQSKHRDTQLFVTCPMRHVSLPVSRPNCKKLELACLHRTHCFLSSFHVLKRFMRSRALTVSSYSFKTQRVLMTSLFTTSELETPCMLMKSFCDRSSLSFTAYSLCCRSSYSVAETYHNQTSSFTWISPIMASSPSGSSSTRRSFGRSLWLFRGLHFMCKRTRAGAFERSMGWLELGRVAGLLWLSMCCFLFKRRRYTGVWEVCAVTVGALALVFHW